MAKKIDSALISEEEKEISQLKLKLSKVLNDKTLAGFVDDLIILLNGLKLDKSSIFSGIIYSYAKVDYSILEKIEIDQDTKNLIDMLFLCDKYAESYADADGLKNMLLAIAKDIRVIIIKTIWVLCNARRLVKQTENDYAKTIFKLIDDLYAPFSARLGLSEIKSELQDLSFEFNHPEDYVLLKKEVAKETRTNEKLISQMVEKITNLLNKNGISCKCYGRVKHLSSIYNKLRDKHCSIKNIYDISAVRILVEQESECYQVLGIIHSNFVPVDGRFKDYIAQPKPNGYKSIHTTVYFGNEFFEVQIRTNAMHEFAEYGVAAHFLYKEKKSKLSDFDSKFIWIKKLLENKENFTPNELLAQLKTDVYLGEIFVQTPKGKIVKLVEGATPVDFAYAIHSDIGNRCVGAKVNGNMVQLFSALANGDVVEILTSQNSKGPSRDWLKQVKMQSTREKIGMFFKKQMKEENIKLGKSMVEQYAKANDIQLSSIWQEKWIDILLKKQSFVSVDELFASIGYGSLTAEKIVKRLASLKAQEENDKKTILDTVKNSPLKFENKSKITGVAGAVTNFCKNCNPIPGDEIVGYVSRGRGIIIHKTNCENLAHLQKDRLIKVNWNENAQGDFSFVTYIDLVAKNTQNIYVDITTALNEMKVKVVSLNSSINKNEELLLKIGIAINGRAELIKVKNKLSAIPLIFEVK